MAGQLRRAGAHVHQLAARAGNERLHAALILMCWTLNPSSGRAWRDYFPGAGAVEVLGWDCYNTTHPVGYVDPAVMLSRVLDVSARTGKPFGLAEWGSKLVRGDDGSGRAAWLLAVAAYLRQSGAVFATYFDSLVGGDFRLSDRRSRQAWVAVQRAAPVPSPPPALEYWRAGGH